MEKKIRGELTLREALQELDNGNDVIVLQPRTLDMVENDFIISELGEWLRGCHLLLVEPVDRLSAEGTCATSVPESSKVEPMPVEPGKAEGKALRSSTKKTVDAGRIKALYQAGWSQAKIADDMKISDTTASNYLKKIREGIL